MLYWNLIIPILIGLLWKNNALRIQKEKKYWMCNRISLCIESSNNMQDLPRFENQNDCRMSCGEYGAIWPQPTGECILSHDRIHIDPNMIGFLETAPTSETIEFIEAIKEIFIHNILKEIVANGSLVDPQKLVVNISVKSPSLDLNWKTDESYSLKIISTEEPTVVLIKAETVFGSRHALETLSNLMTGSQVSGLIMVRNAQIVDEPKYPHRGLMIDTSRNFIPIENIERALDAMAASKLNVFHWHITDSHSFPLEITRVPELHMTGAYSEDQVYSQTVTRCIVKYAKIRGIRVLIEIPGPSHAGNGWQWGLSAGLGKLAVCFNNENMAKLCTHPPCGQLNPVNNEMYRILKDIYADLAEIIEPEETLHMGGDDVNISCWRTVKEIEHKANDGGDNNFLKLWANFHLHNYGTWNVINHQHTASKPVILWSSRLTEAEIIEKYLPNDHFIIQTSVKSNSNLDRRLLGKGYQIIISTSDVWNLDNGFVAGTKYAHWEQIYRNPLIRNRLVLGGETCIWTDFIDKHSLESRTWPRAGAAAERLWSNPIKFSSHVVNRFHRYRQRLIARGFQPEGTTSQWCVINEGQCY